MAQIVLRSDKCDDFVCFIYSLASITTHTSHHSYMRACLKHFYSLWWSNALCCYIIRTSNRVRLKLYYNILFIIMYKIYIYRVNCTFLHLYSTYMRILCTQYIVYNVGKTHAWTLQIVQFGYTYNVYVYKTRTCGMYIIFRDLNTNIIAFRLFRDCAYRPNIILYSK